MMSNTAPGFAYITFNTVRPFKTWIGSFEGQLIGGKLENSGFAPFDTTLEISGAKIYVPKKNDWRYINGVVLSYQPRFIKGAFFGVTRTFIFYNNDLGTKLKSYLPVITPIDKKSTFGEGEGNGAGDQRASAFIRWVWLKENAELYCEFFREDHAYDFRDMFLEPDHTHAYLFGLQKLIPLSKKDQYIQIKLELTQLAQRGTNPERPAGSVYLHYAGISQGYTNQGQLLGAGIGPGSNLQTLHFSWTKNLQSIGVQFERYVHNSDFYTSVIRDIRANWVDFSTTAFITTDWKNLIFSVSTGIIRNYNYQFLYIRNHPLRLIFGIQGRTSIIIRGKFV
jgi:hypothetical protein